MNYTLTLSRSTGVLFAGSGLLTGGRSLTGFMNIPKFKSLGVRLDSATSDVDLSSLARFSFFFSDFLAGFDWGWRDGLG